MPRALSHVTLITAWISGCVCRIGDWAEHSCSETGYIFRPAVDFSQSHLKVSCVCGLLWLSSPLSPTTSHVFSRGLLGCCLGQCSTWEHISSELLRYSQLERTICHLSHKDVFPSCASPSHWPMGATCCYAQPLLRNSSILCLLFSGLIAGRPNMALLNASALASLLAELTLVSRERVRFGVGTSCSPPW